MKLSEIACVFLHRDARFEEGIITQKILSSLWFISVDRFYL